MNPYIAFKDDKYANRVRDYSIGAILEADMAKGIVSVPAISIIRNLD